MQVINFSHFALPTAKKLCYGWDLTIFNLIFRWIKLGKYWKLEISNKEE